MADILLTHGYFLDEDEKERQIMKPYPPLGLLYLAASLESAGFDVELFDSTLGTRRQLHERIQNGPPVVGISTNLMTRASVVDLVRQAKRAGRSVVLGGPEAANYPDEYLRCGADVIVSGEGERTIEELLPALQRFGTNRLHAVAGVIFRDEQGTVAATPARAQIAELDSLPWPARHRIDQTRYVDLWRQHHGRGSVNLITARGCPYRCNWCSHSVFGLTHRRRGVEDCVREVEHIVEAWKPDQLWYADDVFTIHHRWLHAFAERLRQRGLKLPFETISRADRMMDRSILETLASMGCYRVWIGSESGSQRILDAMQRGVTVEQVQWAAQEARRHGIEVGMFLMWGYEGETPDDVDATVEHVKRAAPDVFFTTVSYPIKGTPYYEKVASRLSLDMAWAEASDRDLSVGGRPPRDYYRAADQYLRNEVAASKLDQSDPLRAAEHRALAIEARNTLHRLAAATEAIS